MSVEMAEYVIWRSGLGLYYEADRWYEALAVLLAERSPA